MVTKVYIKDNKNSPIHYLSDIKAFTNGKEYTFNTGVNIIVGENGCGKTTLLNLIKKYLIVDYEQCDKGEFNCNINSLYKKYHVSDNSELLDGVDVYADYEKNTFRLSHYGEKSGEKALENFNSFGTLFTQKHVSTGEAVNVAINSLFKLIFSENAKLKYNYSKFKSNYQEYFNYVESHKVKCPNEYTILMDEPDRNLSLENINQIKSILSIHKPQTQLIIVIHNPLLICALQKYEHINWIEMSDNYIHNINTTIRSLLR